MGGRNWSGKGKRRGGGGEGGGGREQAGGDDEVVIGDACRGGRVCEVRARKRAC